MDYFIDPEWFITGQGLGPYGGDAGAYMIGLLGTGVRTHITRNIFAELEGLVGAAGGGGLNTGGGLVYQANVYGISLAYKFNVLTFSK